MTSSYDLFVFYYKPKEPLAMPTVTLTSDANAPWRKNRPPRAPRRADTCHYCGKHYHPMPLWTHPAEPGIWVCEWDFDWEDDNNPMRARDECQAKAREAGYTKRLDLTPKR